MNNTSRQTTPFDEASRVLSIYEPPHTPAPRALALRLMEEAVELAMACGASAEDVNISVGESLKNEQVKDLSRTYDEKRIASHEEIVGEVADVGILLSVTSMLAKTMTDEVMDAARAKVDRLLEAKANGDLIIKPDGRFYRRRKE